MVSERRFNSIYKNVDKLYVDGSLICLLLKTFGFKNIKRYSFDMTSLAGPFFEKLEASGEALFIIGSTPNNIEVFVDWLKDEYPKTLISGAREDRLVSVDDKTKWEVAARLRK